MKSNKKSWKTTLVGAGLAGLLALQTLMVDGIVLNKAQIVKLGIAFCVAALGVVSKDYDSTGVPNE